MYSLCLFVPAFPSLSSWDITHSWLPVGWRQASFTVIVKVEADVFPPETCASWLHAVAGGFVVPEGCPKISVGIPATSRTAPTAKRSYGPMRFERRRYQLL